VYAPLVPWPREGERPHPDAPLEEEVFAGLDEREIGGDHERDGGEQRPGEGREAERVGEGREGDKGADSGAGERRQEEGPARAAAQEGHRRVRMMKMTRVWVVSDSTNQPDWKSVSLASKA
jgi:hypothetical protein